MVLLQFILVWFEEGLIKFTFQYGTTSIQKPVSVSGIGISFTFQYGTTSINATHVQMIREEEFTFQYGTTSMYVYISIVVL